MEQAFVIKLDEFTQHTAQASSDLPELTSLEKIILQLVSEKHKSLYSAQTRKLMAERLGVENVSSQIVQGQLRKLEKKELIIKNAHGNYEPTMIFDFE